MTETLAATATKLQRSSGTVRLSFKRRGSKTVLDALYQEGCYKARFPQPDGRQPTEAILINTSGGLTDGDYLSCVASWHADTGALITTQAAERIYKSRSEAATIHTRLNIGERAAACWLPQETILFDGGRLDRTTDVEMSQGASLFAVESIVFGRTGMGEVTRSGRVFDRWRIRSGGKLLFADAVLLDDAGDGQLTRYLARASIADGASVIATILYVGDNCAARLDSFRRALAQSDVVAGASILGPVVVARVLARSGQCMRDAVMRVFEATQCGRNVDRANQHFELPRVWRC